MAKIILRFPDISYVREHTTFHSGCESFGFGSIFPSLYGSCINGLLKSKSTYIYYKWSSYYFLFISQKPSMLEISFCSTVKLTQSYIMDILN
jgi:hypothetical protein